MRAVTYIGDETFRVEERDPRAPGRGEVRIDVAYVGICGTDLHIKHGAMDGRVSIPAVIGHEMSGIVAAVGDGVTAWQPGDSVTVMPLKWCGTCPACRAGHQHVCQNLVFVGIDAAGAMQQSWTVSQDLLVRLPHNLPLDRAALAEPVAVAVHDVRRAGLAARDHALVVGGGPIGLLIAVVAASEGADVLVSEPNGFRRAVGLGRHRPASRRQSMSTFTTSPPLSRVANASAVRSSGSTAEISRAAGIAPAARSSTARSKSRRS